MIHGMLCTLTIGTVLPEPEPSRYWLVMQVVQWKITNEDDVSSEPPATAKVVGEVSVAVGDRRTASTCIIPPDPGRLGSLQAVLEGRVRNSVLVGDGLKLNLCVTYSRPPITGGADHWFSIIDKRIELKCGDRMWLGNCDQHPGLGFVARLHRVK